MKWIAIAGGVIVVLVLVVIVAGMMQPVQHRASRSASYHASPAQVYALITAVDAFPQWRAKVRAVEHESPTRYCEIGDDGKILYEISERVPNERVVTRIADPSLPFGGRWTYELAPAPGGGTTLRITEDGEVYNPVFRFVSKFVMGHTATIDQYLKDVGKRLNPEPTSSATLSQTD